MAKEIFTGMTAKQKGMIGAMVVVVLVIVWQVIGLIGGSGSTPPAQSMPVANKNSAANKTTPTATAANNHALQQNQLQQATVASDTRFLQLQQMSEQKYIGKLNDLEDLRIQREIAETNQAIATAKLATVTAEKNISDLLTKPAMPEVSIAAYANRLAGPGSGADETTSLSSTTTTTTTSEGYTIISVSMQLHKWNAIIGYQGKLFTVAVGDVLAPDSSVVININKNGVTLKKDDKIRKISITSGL